MAQHIETISLSMDNESLKTKAYRFTVEQLFAHYQTSRSGLSPEEVELRKDSRSSISDEEPSQLLSEFLDKFKEPLVLLLLASAVVSLLVGAYDDAICIFLAVVIVSTVAFVQELKSQHAIEALKSYQAPFCTVFRNSQLAVIPAEELVLGDIVFLKQGNKVPCDLRLFDTTDLQVDESMLTGESQLVTKTSQMIDQEAELYEQTNMAFHGTMVMTGIGKGIAVALGEDTQLGKIAKDLKETTSEKTPLQIKMDELGKQLSILSGIIISITCLIGIFQGHGLLDMFNVGVSLAVAAIPEGLPVVVTVTLAIGVSRMAKRNAIVRKLPAVEALGGIDLICCDKTGTITENKMRITHVVTDRMILAEPRDLQGQLQFRDPSTNKLIDPSSDNHLNQVLRIGMLCNNAHIDELTGTLVGEPTEGALLQGAMSAGIPDSRSKFERKQEIPFDHTTKFMAVVLETAEGPKYFVKGAFEVIMDRCSDWFSRSQNKMQIKEFYTTIASSGLRVLALAIGSDLNKLTFVGLVGIKDSIRFGVKESIKRAQDAGIHVAMLTGDSKETAIAIASDLNIFQHGAVALSPKELEEVSHSQRTSEILENVSVFYRMTPSAKLKIIESYQSLGHVVSMTGDGTNDAPSLKKATIGIAMGTGTDVAKEAAEIVLVDNNFSTIVAAIEEGRAIFTNIQNFIRFQLTTSMAAMGLLLYCTLAGLPLPLNPMQILWINIIMDGPPAQSLGVEPVQGDVMKKHPRDPKKPVITHEILQKVFGLGLVMILTCLYIFTSSRELYPETDTQNKFRSTTITFTSFVFLQLYNAINCRSRNSIFTLSPISNKFFVFAVGGSALCQLLVIYMPFFNYIFETQPLSFHDLSRATFIPAIVVLVDEIWKRLYPTKE